MTKQNHNHTPTTNSFAHAALVERLIGEAFAIENRLADHTLEQVGEHLEASKLAFDAHTEPMTTLQTALKESFERCHSVYCELLFELDMVPAPEVFTKTLWELSQHEKVTQMIQIPRPAVAPTEDEPKAEPEANSEDLPPLWNQIEMDAALENSAESEEPAPAPTADAVEAIWKEDLPAPMATESGLAAQELPLAEPLWPDQPADAPEEDAFNDQPETPMPVEDLPLPDAFPSDESFPSEAEIQLAPDFEPEPKSQEEVSALNSLESLDSESSQWQMDLKLEEQTKSFARNLVEAAKAQEAPTYDEPEKVETPLPSADELPTIEPINASSDEEAELHVSQAVEWQEEPKENKALDELFAEADRKRAAEKAQALAAEEAAMAPLESSVTESEPVVSSETSYNHARVTPAVREVGQEENKPHYNDFWTTAEWFGALQTPLPSPISKLARKRIATLMQALSVEHQLANLMHPVLHQAWASRRDWLRLLAKGPLPLKEIPPEIKAAVNAVAQQRLELVHEKRFPHPGIVNSINYFLDVEFEKLRPTLLDHGTLILFFGFHRQWAGTQFPNILSLTGLDESEVTELSLRLFRLHKLRNKALAMGEPFDNEAFDLASEDAARIHVLLVKVGKQTDAAPAQQVA